MPRPCDLGKVPQELPVGAPAGCCDLLRIFTGVASALFLFLGVLSASETKPSEKRPAHLQGLTGVSELSLTAWLIPVQKCV